MALCGSGGLPVSRDKEEMWEMEARPGFSVPSSQLPPLPSPAEVHGTGAAGSWESRIPSDVFCC